ncbi:MAG: hypothetical protein V4757_09235 [Pseudomonadota bacterium]
MKIAYANGTDWHKDHPTGALVFQYLITGESGSPDNFMFILARQDKDFLMQRHRHNFEQIRLPLKGDMNIGERLMLNEGEVGYFPEGLPYGPQNDPLGRAQPGERLQLVLQFGGASGCGFMSMDQRKAAWAELEKTGHFEGPNYHRPDGRVQWGLNAIWEKVFGERLKYPMPRYDHVVMADPKRFHWLSVRGAKGTQNRYLGAFSERRVWVEMVKQSAGAQWNVASDESRRLLFVLSGEGSVNATEVRQNAAIEVAPGESAEFTSVGGMELFMIGLPPIVLPEVAETPYDVEDGMIDPPQKVAA